MWEGRGGGGSSFGNLAPPPRDREERHREARGPGRDLRGCVGQADETQTSGASAHPGLSLQPVCAPGELTSPFIEHFIEVQFVY